MSGPNRLSDARSRHAVALALAFMLPAVALPAAAGELYQWKDANGVTHYSDSPPPSGADYENRTIQDSGTATIVVEAAATPAENTQCTTARGNLALLQGEGPVGTDDDKDGKPDTAFTAEQREAQARLAEAAINVHCRADAGTAAGAS